MVNLRGKEAELLMLEHLVDLMHHIKIVGVKSVWVDQYEVRFEFLDGTLRGKEFSFMWDKRYDSYYKGG